MASLETRISDYLSRHPRSSARQIAAAINENKSTVNAALYAGRNTLFSTAGTAPPLWIAYSPATDDGLKYQDCEGRGLPGVMGYKTGATGDGAYKRRQILVRIMEKPLPRINSKAYMDEWGTIMSAKRLTRLVDHLAVQHNTRPMGRFKDSHREWVADIEYLLERCASLGVTRPYLK